MFRYFTYTGEYRWVDILQDLITSYNNSYHSAIDMRPSDVSHENQEDVWNRLYPLEADTATTMFKFVVGDMVRKHSTVFKKGYLPIWSDEIFVISDHYHTDPPVYSLQDQAGDDLKGTWYE